MEKENFQMHGQASQDLFHWTKGHLTDIHGPGSDWWGNKRLQDPSMYGQICGSICLMQLTRKQNKDGQSREQSSTMPGNHVVSSSQNQMMKKFKIPWKTLVESWKFRCQQQCLVKHQQIAAEKPAAILGKNKTRYACIVDADGSMRKRLKVCRTGITKITSLQKE